MPNPHGMRLPVSVKAVVGQDGRVLLAQNERNEWELPGGRLEEGEAVEECLARELFEETGWVVEPERLLDVWVYEVRPGRSVLIVTFGCSTRTTRAPVVSDEHRELRLFRPTEVAALDMPDGYKRSIFSWLS